MKKGILIGITVIILILSVVISSCKSQAPAAVQAPTTTTTPAPVATTLHYVIGYGDSHPSSLSIKWFAEEISKQSGGRLKIEPHWGTDLCKVTENLNAIKTGLADIGWLSSGYTPSATSLMTAFDVIFVTDAFDARAKAAYELSQTYPDFMKEMSDNNLKVLFFQEMEPTGLYTMKKAETPADIKGLKIRAFGWVAQALQNWGASPVSIAATEVPDALSKGVIDATSGFGISQAMNFKLHEAVKFVCEPGMGSYALCNHAINKNKFDSLPADLQTVVTNAGSKMTDKFTEMVDSLWLKHVEAYKQNGVTIVSFTPTQRKVWVDAANPNSIYQAWKDQYKDKIPNASAWFDLQLSTVQKFEKSSTWKNPFK